MGAGHWDVPRSSCYAAQAPERQSAVSAPPATRRGPKPGISDEALLTAIERDLDTPPWTRESHSKVWARRPNRFPAGPSSGA